MYLPLPLLLLLLAILVAAASGAVVLGLRAARATRAVSPASSASPPAATPERQRTDTLLQLSAELPALLDLDPLLDRALTLMAEAVNAERAAVQLVTPGSDRLLLRASMAAGKPALAVRPSPFRRNEGLAGWVIQHRQPARIADLARDARWIPYEGHPEGNRSALAVPLIAGEEALGALLLLSSQPSAFGEDDLQLACGAANLIAAAIRNADLYRIIRDQNAQLEDVLRAQQVEASRSRAILESIADGVFVTGPTHDITLYNAAAEQILGLKRSRVVGHPAVEFIGLYGPAGRRWAETVQAWSQHPPPPSEQAVLSEHLELEDQRVVSVLMAPVVSGGEFLGTVSIFRDITRQVEVDRLKSDFVATVSHELRTPMTAIRGYVQMLLLDAAGTLSEEQRRFLEIIRSNAERLGHLVNDLLDISRLEAGQGGLELQTVDTREALQTARGYLVNRCTQDAKALRVVAEVPDTLPAVHGDPVRLQRILAGLLDNSYNFTPAGGTVTIAARPTGGEVEIVISDSGAGIPPADQPRVFDRFFRGAQALTMGVPGTGLGLSIVAQLVRMHGGRIWVQSEGEPGKGSTFTFTLPMAASEPAAALTQV